MKAFNAHGRRSIQRDGTLPRVEGGVNYEVAYRLLHEARARATTRGWYGVIHRPSCTTWISLGETGTYPAAYYLVWLPEADFDEWGTRTWAAGQIHRLEEEEPGKQWHAKKRQLIDEANHLAAERDPT